MKIGPVDIGIPVLINIGGCVIAVVVLFSLWNKGAELRHEAFYRDKIMRGLSDGLPERQSEGAKACLDFLKVEPDHVPAKLTLANIYAAQGNFAGAKQLFEEIAKMSKATSTEKAYALNGAGVSTFKAAPKDAMGPALDEAEKLFRAAIEADKEFADPHANIALLQPHKSPDKWIVTAEAPAKTAIESRVPPTAEALENLYRLVGMIQKEKRQAGEAVKSFDAAQTIRPTGVGGNDQMRRTTKIAALVEEGLSAETRRGLINELERAIPGMGDRKQQSNACIALGLAWMEMSKEPDWGTNGYLAAIRAYTRALDFDPQNVLAYQNFSALYDRRVNEFSAQLKGQVTSFNGITPPLDPVKDGPRARRMHPGDKNTLPEIRRVLKDHEDLWRRFIDKAGPAPKEKIAALLDIMILVRRQGYTMDVDEEPTLKVTLDRAYLAGKEAELLEPENGLVNFSVGMLLLDMKRFGDAQIRFNKAVAAGFKSPLIDKVLTELNRKPELLSARPADGQRWFGKRPLVYATLYSPNASDGFRSIEVTHNGATASPMLTGTQLLYLPDVSKLTDGKHVIQVAVVEAASGNKIQFPPLEFSIDRLPPTYKLSPDGGEVDGKAVFTISLADPTGVDLASVRVLYRSMDNAKNPTNREIVLSGRYKVGAPDLNIKGNQTIPGESFKVTAGTIPLPPGAYVLDLFAKDMTGNEMKASKGFQVTK